MTSTIIDGEISLISLETDMGRSAPLIAGAVVGGGEAKTIAYECECKYDRLAIIRMGAFA